MSYAQDTQSKGAHIAARKGLRKTFSTPYMGSDGGTFFF
jgi:hypothetical protein